MSTGKAVFLSYASQDAEAARRIAEALRAAGIEVWFDQAELRGGDAWDRQIRTEHSADMAMGIAEAYAFGGQRDQAFNWLETAHAQKDIFLWAIKGDPFLKNLEGDPRYKAFLRKMNLPE